MIPTRQEICGGKCPLFDGTFNLNSKEEVTQFVISFAKFMTYLAVPIAIIMLVYTGVMVIIGQVKNPISAIINIFIGLAIVILAYTFTGGFAEFLTNGIDVTTLFNQ
jgi:TrbC/VIRB2 pilin